MDLFSYLLGKNSGTGGGGGGNLNWSAIGYTSPPADYIAITNAYNYAKTIYDNWTPQESLQSKFLNDTNLVYMPLVETSITTTMRSAFYGCTKLEILPLLDTSNVENMRTMCNGCNSLSEIPVLDTHKVTNFEAMFGNCVSLSNDSLDNVLQMCINATSYTGTKTLLNLGFSVQNYPASRIQSLPHYQSFISAGWSIGY